MSERRCKAYWLGEDEVLHAFSLHANGMPDWMVLPAPLDLPEGARVHHVRHDWNRRCFVFVVSHLSFPLWADGDVLADAEDRLRWERVAVPIDHDGEGKQRIGWARWLKAENERLRAVFGDLRQDSAPIDAAYRQGLEDAARLVESHGDRRLRPPVASLEIAVRHGPNAAIAAEIRALGDRPASVATEGEEQDRGPDVAGGIRRMMGLGLRVSADDVRRAAGFTEPEQEEPA